MVSHLVDGQDAAAHHLCLRGDEGGEDQPGTVAQEQVRTDVQGLEEGRGGEGRGDVYYSAGHTIVSPVVCSLQYRYAHNGVIQHKMLMGSETCHGCLT